MCSRRSSKWPRARCASDSALCSRGRRPLGLEADRKHEVLRALRAGEARLLERARRIAFERVGVRLSPLSPVNGAALDSDPAGTYGFVAARLSELGIAYLHVIEGVTQGAREVPGGFDLQTLRRAFKGCYMANNGYDLRLALEARRRNLADLISFGRLYIANPDLVERFRYGGPLNEPDRATFFGGGAAGYTDYPPLPTAATVATAAARPPRSQQPG